MPSVPFGHPPPCFLLAQATTSFLIEEFKYRDVDRSGGIDRHELREVMEGLGIELTTEAYDQLLKTYGVKDKWGERQIDQDNFIQMLAPYMRTSPSDNLTEDQLIAMKRNFSRVDTDGSGTIDSGELKTLLIAAGKQVSDKQVEAILAKYDADQNGVLNFDEFVTMVLSP